MTAPAPYFAPLSIGGTVYDLGHLDPVRFQVLSEKLRRPVTVRCRFSNHVFTRTFDPQVDPANTPIIMDGIRQRVFCPDRYRLSIYLPGAIVELREPRIYVRETKARRNWLYVATIEVPADASNPTEGVDSAADSERVRYQVFFVLRKASKSVAAREDVEMVVESAYAEDPARPPELLGRALFAGLATAAVEGRPVHTQPARKR
jgi:hypothetical protein